jgi:arylsulfatase A-like enzyme
MSRLLNCALWCCLLLPVSLWAAANSPQPAMTSGPNILLILLDDLGNNDIAALGDGAADTPELDSLAREGVRYTRHYAHATCRPARVSLLTGMSASRSGVPPYVRGITPELVTLPEALRAGGYSTHHIGKWHLGHHFPSAYPQYQGFDDWYGFLTALTTGEGDLEAPGASYMDPWLEGYGRSRARQVGHMTDLFTEAAVDKILSLADQPRPWFLNLWFFAPHKPIEPAPRFSRRFDDTPQGRYQALLAQVDEAVGKVRQALRESGQERDTLIVLLSDNGGTNSTRDSNKPFFGRKNQYLEGGLRTPLLMYLPGRFESAEVTDAVAIQDVMPTLLELAKVDEPPNLDGRSLLSTLASGDRPKQYYWDFQIGADARYGVMDLEQGTLVYGAGVQAWDTKNNRFLPPEIERREALARAATQYEQWRTAVRRTDLSLARLPDGSVQLTGDSYRRTPGFGGWTLQIPVNIGSRSKVRLRQEGIFDLSVNQQAIQAQVPGYHLSVEAAAAGCQLLSLSTFYIWNDRDPDSSRGYVSLNLGETRLYSGEFDLDPALLRDEYPPLAVSPGAGVPLVVNDYLKSDFEAYYRAATGTRPGCT